MAEPPPLWRAVAIDDQEDILRLYEFMLEGSRIRLVGKATNGHDGLKLIDREAPDLVILDLSMPGMDGLEVLRTIRQGGRMPRVAIISGFDRGRLKKDAVRLGADIYLEKGVAPHEIVQKLEELAARRDPMDELI